MTPQIKAPTDALVKKAIPNSLQPCARENTKARHLSVGVGLDKGEMLCQCLQVPLDVVLNLFKCGSSHFLCPPQWKTYRYPGC